MPTAVWTLDRALAKLAVVALAALFRLETCFPTAAAVDEAMDDIDISLLRMLPALPKPSIRYG
jgi:hypothetical protein